MDDELAREIHREIPPQMDMSVDKTGHDGHIPNIQAFGFALCFPIQFYSGLPQGIDFECWTGFDLNRWCNMLCCLRFVRRNLISDLGSGYASRLCASWFDLANIQPATDPTASGDRHRGEDDQRKCGGR